MKTIDEHITNGVDDVREHLSLHTITYNDLIIDWIARPEIAGGFIFKSVKIFKLSEIVSATLTIKHVSWNNMGLFSLIRVYGWKVCGTLNWQFPPLPQTPTGCMKTTAFGVIDYTGSVLGLPNVCQHPQVVNVAPVIQELVDQAGWTKECDIGFALIFQGIFPRIGTIHMCMQDKSESDSAQLTVMIKPRVILNPLNRYEGVIY